MLSAINPHFQDANATRPYPVDDGATAVDDRGTRLPPDVVTDLNLRWPRPLGNYAFLAGVTVSNSLVTVTVQAATGPGSAGGFSPLAVVSVPRPVDVGRPYPLVAQVPGVGGWIVFGGRANGDAYSGRFSTPAQSRLTGRAAQAYAGLAVDSVQAFPVADRLSGVVTLKADPPLALEAGERTIGGVLRDCVVVKLVDDSAETPTTDGSRPPSVFERFSGPCAGRPASGTCGCPKPIESVNAVAPDCDGVLTLQFTGLARLTRLASGHGLVVDYPIGLADACLPPQIPSSDGLLPGEYTPANVPPVVSPPPPAVTPTSDSHTHAGPFRECFLSSESVSLTTNLGLWAWNADDSPTIVCDETYDAEVSVSGSTVTSEARHAGSYQSVTAATRSVATLAADGVASFRKATAEVKLLAGPAGAKHNAQVVANFRTLSGRGLYFVAHLDYDDQSLSVRRFDGTKFLTVDKTSVPGIVLNVWYRVSLTVVPTAAGITRLTAALETVEDVTGPTASVETTTALYQPSTGKFGVGTDKAVSRFAYLAVEDV